MGPLTMVFGLNIFFCFVEAIAGWWTNSLALFADAGHMLVDVMAIGLSLFAMWLSRKPATAHQTYGYHRVEILAALVNGVLLWGLVLWIWVEAFQRLFQPPEVLGGPMLAVAMCGLVVNVVSGVILSRIAHDNLNVRGAFLHVLFDLLGSCAAVGAGLLIVWKGWFLADPLLSVATAGLIVWGAWKLIQEAVHVLMEGAPSHVDVKAIREAMIQVEGVKAVHDLHVWTLTSGFVAMSGHAVIEDAGTSQEILAQAKRVLNEQFHIEHMTLQLETENWGREERPLRRLK